VDQGTHRTADRTSRAWKPQCALRALWEGDWSCYDLRRLQVAAIEETLDRQGVEGGIGRRSLKDSVAAVASRMAPDRPPRDHLDVAERVLA